MYNRAILRAYCDELGLDKNELIQCYDEEIAPCEEVQAISPSFPPGSKIKTHTAVVWSVIFLFCIGLFLNRGWLIMALSTHYSSDHGSPADDLQTGQPYSEHEASPGQTIQPALKADTAALQPLRLEIVGTEECWLSINRDDLGTVTKILSPGDVELLTATRTISLIVGNAGGISLRINNRAAKTLGQSGQVVHLTIDKDTLQNLFDPSAS
jgi:cytoskeletal protein RodZ